MGRRPVRRRRVPTDATAPAGHRSGSFSQPHIPTLHPPAGHESYRRHARTIQGWADRYARAVLHGKGGRAAVALAAAKSPLRATRAAFGAVRMYGPPAARATGIPIPKQFARCWWLSFHRRFDATLFYKFGLYRDAMWNVAPLVAQESDSVIAFRVAANRIDLHAARTLANKDLFEAWSRREDIPAARVVAVYDRGVRVDTPDTGDLLPPHDLFIKWANRSGGIETLRGDHGAGDRRRANGWGSPPIVRAPRRQRCPGGFGAVRRGTTVPVLIAGPGRVSQDLRGRGRSSGAVRRWHVAHAGSHGAISLSSIVNSWRSNPTAAGTERRKACCKAAGEGM